MKRFKAQDKDRTEEIRAALFFLQFVENKIIKKQVFKINTLELEDIDGFSRFIALHLK